jgi:two-component system chemotaxis response regulator CheB
MPPIRILVVDDSVVVRRVLCNALSSDPAVEVVGTAADGHIALSKIVQLNPDVVTLDVEMPGMTGLETLKEIRKLYPKLPVIMFSTLTERGAVTTLEALTLGASDYVTKPSNTGSLEVTQHHIHQEMMPKLKALCAGQPAFRASQVPGVAKKKTPIPVAGSRPAARIDVLAIGTSTGGPNALSELLKAIPGDFPVPIVIVQHMPPLFTRLLAERLNKETALTIGEAEAGKILEPGQCWIAPGNYHLTLQRKGVNVQLALNQDPPENSCRPAVDVLFRSVAGVFGANSLAVVLTGMGSDGVSGSKNVREQGGHVFVQDEASSVVWGMPGQVAAAGCADNIFSLGAMAGEIDRRVRKSRQLPRPAQDSVGQSAGFSSAPPDSKRAAERDAKLRE